MGFSKSNIDRDKFMLRGMFADDGYDRWKHSFTAINADTGEEKSFFIEFFACNPELGGSEPILGQHESNQLLGKAPSYLMVKAGCWGKEHLQLHRYFAWKDVNITKKAPFCIEAKDCYVSEYELRGSVDVEWDERMTHPEWMSDCGLMSWNLSVHKMIPFNVGYGAGDVLRQLKVFEMYWHAEGMKTMYSGTVTLNGVDYIVKPEFSYGYADKCWGENFANPWLWLSSNDLTSKKSGKKLINSAFNIGGGCSKLFGVPIKNSLMSAFYYEGFEFEFNYSKFWTGTHTKFTTKETEKELLWHVRQESCTAVVDVKVRCAKDEMILADYEAPNGEQRYNNLWNGGTGRGVVRLYEKAQDGLYLVDEMITGHVGCEYGKYDE